MRLWKKISRSRLEPWDNDKKISVSSRIPRFREQNSCSRRDLENKILSLVSNSKIRTSYLKSRDIVTAEVVFLHQVAPGHIVLLLVSKHESEDGNSRSLLEAWDLKEKILNFVSKHKTDWKILVLVSRYETQRQKFSISSRSTRLKGRNSRSRLKASDWK